MHRMHVFAVIVMIGFVCATNLNANDPESENGEQPVRIDVKVPQVGKGGLLIPQADEISGITVDLYNNPFEFPSVERFTVQEKDIVALMRQFENCETDPMPNLSFTEIGSMRITEKSGNVSTIHWYWPLGKGRLCCSVAGVRLIKSGAHWQRVDDGLSVDLFVRRLLFEQTGKETRKATR